MASRVPRSTVPPLSVSDRFPLRLAKPQTAAFPAGPAPRAKRPLRSVIRRQRNPLPSSDSVSFAPVAEAPAVDARWSTLFMRFSVRLMSRGGLLAKCGLVMLNLAVLCYLQESRSSSRPSNESRETRDVY